MPKFIPKRAQIMCDIFQKQISEMDFSKKGEDRVKEFLKVIDFEDAGELMKSSLLVVEEQKYPSLKTMDVYHILEKKGLQIDMPEYYSRLGSDFKRWSHCEEVREAAGKPTGASDIFRMYELLINAN